MNSSALYMYFYCSFLLSSSLVAMTQSLWIGWSYLPILVLIRTFLTNPSFPGKASVISTSSHCERLQFGLSSRTKSPILTFSLVWNHLFRGNSVRAKYFIQHIQSLPTLFWTLLIRCFWLTLAFSSSWGGVLCRPIRRSLGVMGSSSQMSSELG